MTLTITLPWPAKELSPNARVHWAVRNKHRKAAREGAAWLALITLGRKKLAFARAAVTIEFSPPDRRKRDVDNMLASCKAMLDGVAEAIAIDDSNWFITMRRAEDFAGEVRLTINGVTVIA